MSEPNVRRPGRRSQIVLALLWLVLGLTMIVVVAWLAVTRRNPLLNGSPVTLVLVLICLVVGLVATVSAVSIMVGMVRRDDERVDRTDRQLRRRARIRLALAIPALIIGVVLVGTLAYVRPFAASADAVAALRSGDDVRVVDRFTWYELVPTGKDQDDNTIAPTAGLVFAPGARVDPRAYAALLRPLAEQGYLVCVLKEPLGLAITDPDQAGTVIAAHPQIGTWAVGGHSLGGAAISGYAQQHSVVRGLVLYGSYPINAVDRTGLAVLSVAGGNDQLATPTDIDAAKSDLPADTTYVVIAGGIHAYFGDYGTQPGDGVPSVDRAKAQQQIIAATLTFMQALPTPN